MPDSCEIMEGQLTMSRPAPKLKFTGLPLRKPVVAPAITPREPSPVTNPQPFRIAMKCAALSLVLLAFSNCISMSSAADVPAGRQYHVSPQGSDANDGSASKMLKTISAAARRAQPGDVITVHKGVYRERVDPPRGGQSDAKRIVYQAAPGEKVEIKGSEIVKHWEKVQGDTWKVTLPNKFFGKFNPFADLIHGDWFSPQGRQHHTGAVYLNGDWLIEAAKLADVLKPAGKTPLWFGQVDKEKTTIWAQFKGVNPNEHLVEINVRRTVFYPERTGINYLTVRGFTMHHAATPWAPPTAEQIGPDRHALEQRLDHREQRDQPFEVLGHRAGQVRRRSGTTRGQVGRRLRRHHPPRRGKRLVQEEHRPPRRPQQHHLPLRADGHRRQPGCRLQLVTGNTIHDIHVQRLFSGAEMAGIKFHGAIDVQIRGNHIYRTCLGVWLDWMAQGTRVTQNLFHDNNCDLFVEVDHGPFVVDDNLFLSPMALLINSQGGAYVHNLIAGGTHLISYDARQTPFHKAHSTELAGLHDNACGDDRYYNNLLVGAAV